MKNEKRKQIFLKIYFDLKPISKNQNQNFRIHFLFWNQKMNFKKLFHFSILVVKMKNKKRKIFKIRFVFKSKNELYFRYTDSVHFSFYIFKKKLKKQLLKKIKNKFMAIFTSLVYMLFKSKFGSNPLRFSAV